MRRSRLLSRQGAMRCTRGRGLVGALVSVAIAAAGANAAEPLMSRQDAAAALAAYFEAMSVPEPFPVLTGAALEARQRELRARILTDVSLDPLPERIALDVHRSAPIDHPWCTIEKIEYQLWPGVYTPALLYVPKEFAEKPAPAVLCPHGHWDHGYAFPDVQKRCLVLARMGYVVLSPQQNHLENLPLGLSHQTHMIWTNMRGLDVLQSLPEVDPERLGAAGASGGGLQTQMLAALDPRVKAAVIVGLTRDYREIMFAHAQHCGCNHWPNVMTYTDQPEISALAYPRPVQYLVMNDWTRHFPHDNYPTILELYQANGTPDHVACTYWPTEHLYDRPKRERTYWWMEKWLRQKGSIKQAIPEEPEEVVTVYPPEVLENWPVDNPSNQGLNHLEELFRERFRFTPRAVATPDNWAAYSKDMAAALPKLLGLDAGLPPAGASCEVKSREERHGVAVEQVLFSSEGPVRVPALVLRPAREPEGAGPVTLVLSRSGSAPAEGALAQYMDRARGGEWVVLPDVRFSGVYDLMELGGILGPDLVKFDIASNSPAYEKPEDQRKYLLAGWERNSILWGQPLSGMVVADIQHVLEGLKDIPGARLDDLRLETHDAAYLGLAAVFAAALDPRVRRIDVDLKDRRYDAYQDWHKQPDGLPVIPFILRHGDVPQWLGVVAGRDITARNLKAGPDEIEWLRQAFAAAGNEAGLHLEGTAP